MQNTLYCAGDQLSESVRTLEGFLFSNEVFSNKTEMNFAGLQLFENRNRWTGNLTWPISDC